MSFVAINYIACTPEYRERFEQLFATRAQAIDRMPGFISFELLKPAAEDGDSPYLIMTHWERRADFEAWTQSEEFVEGHRRGFADLKRYKDEGRPAPMSSQFRVYEVLAR
jgi:heme oxygenase (mycobilin-producing)